MNVISIVTLINVLKTHIKYKSLKSVPLSQRSIVEGTGAREAIAKVTGGGGSSYPEAYITTPIIYTGPAGGRE